MLAEAKVSGVFPYEPGWSVDKSLTTGMAPGGGTGTFWGQPHTHRDLKFTNMMATLIPPFNLSLVYTTEVLESQIAKPDGTYDIAAGAWRLSGVEFITEGLVTSTHDTITEVTAQFVATGMNPFSMNILNVNPGDQPDIAASILGHESSVANSVTQQHMDIMARLSARQVA
jgi:hypothetical protein